MGEACEHFLYDKGYGPTNLTLKRYLAALFPEQGEADLPLIEGFPAVEASMLPIGDGLRADLVPDHTTPPSLQRGSSATQRARPLSGRATRRSRTIR
jgi:hypothetical protein